MKHERSWINATSIKKLFLVEMIYINYTNSTKKNKVEI